ncbi:MAG: hypothetical protein RIQ52_1818 [Pseudomonadota bacterium]|jgi:hypothetical protein
MKPLSSVSVLLGVGVLLAGCGGVNSQGPSAGVGRAANELQTGQSPSSSGTAFVPGLGEIMAQTAARHVKLWFAGQGKNWALAAYELDEIREGLDDAGKYHPTHKSIAAPIPILIKSWMDKPLAGLDEAVKARDLVRFTRHFDELTEGCNACHRGTDFGYNQVIRPNFNPFPSQSFTATDPS